MNDITVIGVDKRILSHIRQRSIPRAAPEHAIDIR